MNKEINKTELKKVLLFFNSIKNEKYCIIKKPSNFPYLLIGSDLDIIVENIDLFEERFNDYWKTLNLLIQKTARGLGKYASIFTITIICLFVLMYIFISMKPV